MTLLLLFFVKNNPDLAPQSTFERVMATTLLACTVVFDVLLLAAVWRWPLEAGVVAVVTYALWRVTGLMRRDSESES